MDSVGAPRTSDPTPIRLALAVRDGSNARSSNRPPLCTGPTCHRIIIQDRPLWSEYLDTTTRTIRLKETKKV